MTRSPPASRDREVNRASWDLLARIHGQDDYYDSAALIAGASTLIEEEESALAAALGSDIAGKRILHLQCHLGFDAITFARRGARVTGVDFSPVALDRAQDLARRCGVRIEWLCADATDLPAALADRFDLVWATMGILCWIDDVSAWMQAVFDVLAPGGRLVLLDGHPGGEEPVPEQEWLAGRGFRPARRYIESGCDYATTSRAGPQVQFHHCLPAIVGAAEAAGMRVLELHEHRSASSHLCIESFQREPDGRYRIRLNGEPQPILYTLITARNPGSK